MSRFSWRQRFCSENKVNASINIIVLLLSVWATQEVRAKSSSEITLESSQQIFQHDSKVPKLEGESAGSLVCDADSPLGCYEAGSVYLKGEDRPKDLKKALGYFEIACANKHAMACYEKGRMLRWGMGVTVDYSKALSALELACQLNSAQGCRLYAFSFMKINAIEAARLSPRVESKFKKAVRIFKRECENKNGRSCLDYSRMLERGLGVKTDKRRALSFQKMALGLLEKECDAKKGGACSLVGDIHLDNERDPQRIPKAMKSFEIACAMKSAEGCHNAGHITEFTQEKKDLGKALEYQLKACELGSSAGCYFASEQIATGKVVAADQKRQFTLLETACQWSSEGACMRLGFFYEYGLNTTKNPEQARQYYKRSCDLDGNLGCVLFGNTLESAVGGEKDEAQARKIYVGECNNSFGLGCKYAGDVFRKGIGGAQDQKQSRKFYEQGCQLKNPESCRLAAIQYQFGEGGPKNFGKAIELHKLACDADLETSCMLLGIIYTTELTKFRDLKAAKIPFMKACDLGLAHGCFAAAVTILKSHDASSAAVAEARGLFQRSCEGDYPRACHNYAVMAFDGEGGPIDLDEAQKYMKKACQLGLKDSCSDSRKKVY